MGWGRSILIDADPGDMICSTRGDVSMSAIVAVCGTNFCTFVSDGRLVKYNQDGTPFVIRDDFKKTKALNQHLVIGVTGIGEDASDFMKPFRKYRNRTSTMSVEEASDILRDYLSNTKPYVMNFIVGGTDKGIFCMHALHYAAENGNVEEHRYVPRPPHNFASFFSFPQSADGEEYYLNKYIKGTAPWKSLNDLVQHMSDAIDEASRNDPTVGKHIYVNTIVK